MSASLAAALAIGCSSNARPDFPDGSVFDPCWQQCTPDPGGVCQHTCTLDPGPRPVDCKAAEADYIFANDFIGDFQDRQRQPGFYSYTDNSQVIATFVDRTRRAKVKLRPRNTTPNARRCPTQLAAVAKNLAASDRPARSLLEPANPVFRTSAPRAGWAVSLVGRRRRQGDEVLPPATDGRPTTWREVVYDVSQWDGISFWARRGPDSQAGFRVLIGDKNTDDDVSYLMYREDPTMPRFCERVRECACLNHMPCTAYRAR